MLASLLAMDPFELIGLGSGLLCVWLLIRQNVWTFPIGLLYALVSLVIFLDARLYADFTEHIYYVVMNAYGWFYWLRGQGRRAGDDTLQVTRIGRRAGASLVALTLVLTAGIGAYLDNFTDASLPYWDTSTTVMSFIAMWMTARKYIENWYVWFVVDVIKTIIYVVKGIDLYAVLYGVYLGMAVAGWLAWQRSMSAVHSR